MVRLCRGCALQSCPVLVTNQVLPMAGDVLKADNENFYYSLDSAECQN